MSKKKLIRNSDFPYHISARSNNREWFDLPMDKVWRIFSDYLYFISMAFDVEIHAFVLMNNHYHLIMRTPKANIDEAMQYFQRETSRQISQSTNRINHVFGGPYHPTLIRDLNHYNNVYKYVLRNPISAGICNDVIDYSYSTLNGLLGFRALGFPVFANDELFTDTENLIEWLNTSTDEVTSEIIRKGLRKNEFEVSRCQTNGKMIELQSR
jgi:putative transposase